MKFHRDQRAVSAVVAVVLLVAMTVTLAAFVAIQDPAGLRKNLERESNEPVPESGFYARHSEGYQLEPLGPDAIPFLNSRLVVTADGVESSHPVSALAAQLPSGATSWQPGQLVCIAGEDAACLLPEAQNVSVVIVSGRGIVVQLPNLPAGVQI